MSWYKKQWILYSFISTKIQLLTIKNQKILLANWIRFQLSTLNEKRRCQSIWSKSGNSGNSILPRPKRTNFWSCSFSLPFFRRTDWAERLNYVTASPQRYVLTSFLSGLEIEHLWSKMIFFILIGGCPYLCRLKMSNYWSVKNALQNLFYFNSIRWIHLSFILWLRSLK